MTLPDQPLTFLCKLSQAGGAVRMNWSPHTILIWTLIDRGENKHLSVKWASLMAQLVKNLACNAGDPSSIPGSGRSAGEGIGYPLQYSWASLVAKLVKNPPAVWETWIWSLSWEDALEKGQATHSSTLAYRIPWTIYSPWGCRVRHNWATLKKSVKWLACYHSRGLQQNWSQNPRLCVPFIIQRLP